MAKSTYFVRVLIVVLLIVGSLFILKNFANSTGNVVSDKYNLEKFVGCLNDKKVFLYGFPSDNNYEMQMSLFENYAKNVSVVDCSVDLEKCVGVIIYPTWNINDVLVRGGLSLSVISRLSGCPLN